jgi:hypothetical protein
VGWLQGTSCLLSGCTKTAPMPGQTGCAAVRCDCPAAQLGPHTQVCSTTCSACFCRHGTHTAMVSSSAAGLPSRLLCAGSCSFTHILMLSSTLLL